MVKCKFIIKCCCLVLACIMIGSVLITVANYLPINQINKTSSLEKISDEGLFPEAPSMRGEYGSFHSMNPSTMELATDALMLKMALYEGEGEGIEQAFRCYSTQYEAEYSRYWHGYVVILRLLFLVFDYYEVRILNSLFQAFIVGIIALEIWKQKGRKYALALLTSYVLLMPMALGKCLQYSWAFYVTFLALLIFIKYKAYLEQGKRYIYYFILVGAVTIYLDLLTYPLLTWGLLIIWWLILQDKQESILQYLKKVVFSALGWIAGYGGMWIGKWAVGSLVLRENLFTKAISEAFLWTVEGDTVITIKDRLEAVYVNWSMYEYKLYMIILLGWLIYWVICGIVRGNSRSLKAPALILVFCSSFVWYIFLAGHAIMHHIFTHRTFGVSIAAFLGLILLSTEKNEVTGAKAMLKGKKLLLRIAVLCCISLASLCLMLQIKDDYNRHNGALSFSETEFKNATSMTFIPDYTIVKSLNLGISSSSDYNGHYQLTLLHQDDEVDSILIPADELKNGNFHEVKVNWSLKQGHEYKIMIEPTDSDSNTRIWVSNEEGVLSEFREISIDEVKLQGQMLMGITYWCSIPENSKRILFTSTFMGIIMMLIYAGWCVRKPGVK